MAIVLSVGGVWLPMEGLGGHGHRDAGRPDAFMKSPDENCEIGGVSQGGREETRALMVGLV